MRIGEDEQLKIAQVAPFFHPHIGGVETHVYNLSKGLVKKGHKVTVYTSLVKGSKENETYHGITVKRIKPLMTMFTTPVTPGLKERIKQDRHDIIHAHYPPPLASYYAAKASKKKKTPFILTYHCDLVLPKFYGSVITAMYRSSLGRSTLKITNGVIVTTKTYAATSRDLWNIEPSVIPNAIDPSEFNPEGEGHNIRKKHDLQQSQMILYVGRLKYHKGLEYLIESAKHTEADVKYVLVGGGEFKSRLMNLTNELKLKDRIIFAGEVPNSELPQYYSACDIFVLPSVSRLEAFGIVGLEAMASAKPVIISDIPGVREVIEDGVCGLLSEPMNPQDLGKKITRLLADPDLRRKMGEAGKQKVLNEFTWEKVVAQTQELYKKILSSN
jgi:glycosyltransferase involved in cell wall biosynthesis